MHSFMSLSAKWKAILFATSLLAISVGMLVSLS